MVRFASGSIRINMLGRPTDEGPRRPEHAQFVRESCQIYNALGRHDRANDSGARSTVTSYGLWVSTSRGRSGCKQPRPYSCQRGRPRSSSSCGKLACSAAEHSASFWEYRDCHRDSQSRSSNAGAWRSTQSADALRRSIAALRLGLGWRPSNNAALVRWVRQPRWRLRNFHSAAAVAVRQNLSARQTRGIQDLSGPTRRLTTDIERGLTYRFRRKHG